jgi:hypothetical protein
MPYYAQATDCFYLPFSSFREDGRCNEHMQTAGKTYSTLRPTFWIVGIAARYNAHATAWVHGKRSPFKVQGCVLGSGLVVKTQHPLCGTRIYTICCHKTGLGLIDDISTCTRLVWVGG